MAKLVLNHDFLSQSPTNLLPDAVKYAALLKAGYLGAKQAYQNAFVITGGMASGDGSDPRFIKPTAFLQTLYDNGAKGYFDAVGHHPYGMPALPSDVQSWSNWSIMNDLTPSLRSIMVAQGDGNKPIWLTENGEPSCSPQGWYSEDHQAALIAQAIRHQSSLEWAGPQFFWTYIDRFTPINNPDAADLFGIYNSDNTPKQTVYTLRHPGTPTAPTGVYPSHTPGTSKVQLFFNAPLDDGASPITGYIINIKNGDTTSSTDTLSSTATSYVANNLTAGTYSFTITAQNANGSGMSINRNISVFPIVHTTYYDNSFESDTGYFGSANNAILAQSTEASFTGLSSIKLTHSSDANSQIYAGPITGLTADTTVCLSFMYRTPCAATKVLALLDFFTNTGTYVSSLSAECAGDNSHWQYGEVIGKVPANADRCVMIFRKSGGSTASQIVYFDAVKLIS